MFTKKNYLTVSAVVLSALVLGGCGGTPGASVDDRPETTIKVWCAQEEMDLMNNTYIPQFQAAHPDKKYNIKPTAVAEGTAASSASTNVTLAADVLAFVDDNIKTLLDCGYLAEWSGEGRKMIEENSIDWTVKTATVEVDGEKKVYGIPQTSDNGYFLYYNKSIVKNHDTLEGIISELKTANKKFYYDITNGYYIPAFFQAAGCTLTYNPSSDHQEIDYNNEIGVKTFNALYDFYGKNGDNMINGADSVFLAGLADESIAAGISGQWNAKKAKEYLGDDFGIAKLPTFNFGEGIGAKSLYSLTGSKIVGIKSSSKVLQDAAQFAMFITNQENQLKRFEERGNGPANKVAAQDPKVKADEVLTVLAEQSKNSTPQATACGPKFWDALMNVGTIIVEQSQGEQSASEILDTAVATATSNNK